MCYCLNMSEPILCVSWNNHANELEAVWKTLLENNSFVDCTIAAEGKSLKAHRLILSACSPYFHMLFNEEGEKHPIVILNDTLFNTLKILIDFVYTGKSVIPASQLESFLKLATTLQIKGLNNSLHEDRMINILCNAEGEDQQCSSRVDEDFHGVESSLTRNEDSFSESSHQHHCHFSHSNTSSPQNVTSASFEGCSDSTEVMQSKAAMMPPEDHQNFSMQHDPLAPENTDQSLKHEYFLPEIESLALNDVDRTEAMFGNTESEMSKGLAPSLEESFDQFSCAEDPSPPPNQTVHQGAHRVPSPSPTELQPHVRLFRTRFLKCGDCGDIFTSSQALQNHTRQHTESQPLFCDDCGASFTVATDLVTHKLKHIERQYSCNVCGSTFSEMDALTLHKCSDPRKRVYSCDVCSKKFSTLNYVSIHKRTHTGERPYQCDKCGKTFTHLGHLTIHKRKHTGEHPYACDVCDETFAQSSSLASHKRWHTGERPYSCDVCGKAFALSGHLSVHKRSHTGDLPFNCDVRKKTVAPASSLAPPKTAIVCAVCSLRFKCKSSMTKHWERVHMTK